MKRGQAGAATHTSIPEQVIYYYLKKAYRKTVLSYSPEWLRLSHGSRKSEIDVYVPELDLAIEYNGSHWHRGKEWHDQVKEEVIRRHVKTFIVVKEPGLEKVELKTVDYIRQDLEWITGIKEPVLETVLKPADVFYINVPRLDLSYKYLNEVLKEILVIIQKQYSLMVDLKANLSIDLPKIIALSNKNQEKRMLANVYPEIAAEWNYERNGNRTPQSITAQSILRVWWTCPVGHVYPEKVCNRTIGYCNVCEYHKYIKGRKYRYQKKKCAICGIRCALEEMYGTVELQMEGPVNYTSKSPPGYKLLCKDCYQKIKK